MGNARDHAEAIPTVEPECPVQPWNEMRERSVPSENRFWPARRPRCKCNDRRIVRPDRNVGSTCRHVGDDATCNHDGGTLQLHPTAPKIGYKRRQRLMRPAACRNFEPRTRTRRLQAGDQARSRIGRVQYRECRPRFEGPENGPYERCASMAKNGDNVAGFDALGPQVAGNPVADFIELAVAPARRAVEARRPAGAPR